MLVPISEQLLSAADAQSVPPALAGGISKRRQNHPRVNEDLELICD